MIQISRNLIRAAVCLLLCGLLVAAMSGCTTKKTDETIIRESVAEVLGNFKSLDSDMAKRFISDMDIHELESVGLNVTDFMKAYSDGFSYDISDIRIDGKTAEVDLSVYVKSFSEFENRFASEIETLSDKYAVEDEPAVPDSGSIAAPMPEMDDPAGSTSESSAGLSSKIKITTDEMNSMFARTIINCLKDTPVRETKVMTIQFTNSDNTWRPSPTAMDDILTAMMEN